MKPYNSRFNRTIRSPRATARADEHIYRTTGGAKPRPLHGMDTEGGTGMTDEQQTMAKRITDQERERDELEDVLRRNGFVRCDIPACNCGSWHHKYGLPERWAELKDALAEAGHPLTNDNGNLMLNALRALIAERDEALAHAQALWQQMRLINKATYICTNHLKDWSYCVLEVQRLSDEVAAKDHSRDYQITATAPMRTPASALRRR